MNRYKIFYENADTDEPRSYLGFFDAMTQVEALQKASEWHEVPSYDLVAVQMERCPYCQTWQEAGHRWQCPQRQEV